MCPNIQKVIGGRQNKVWICLLIGLRLHGMWLPPTQRVCRAVVRLGGETLSGFCRYNYCSLNITARETKWIFATSNLSYFSVSNPLSSTLLLHLLSVLLMIRAEEWRTHRLIYASFITMLTNPNRTSSLLSLVIWYEAFAAGCWHLFSCRGAFTAVGTSNPLTLIISNPFLLEDRPEFM